jgi:LacI family transcriptional regulator
VIKEVAKRAGVSVGTVSHFLTGAFSVSPDRSDRILAAMRHLDYHPNDVARSLKLSKSHMLGMVVSDITNPFFSQLVRGAEDAALQRNYLLLTFNTDDRVEREMQFLTVLRKRRVDGVLLVIAPSQVFPYHVKELIATGTPVVCLDRVPRGLRVDSVTVDNIRGSRECVRHLIDEGHRRIAILTGSLLLQTARERLKGYKQALTGRNLAIDPALVCEGNFRMDSGYQIARNLLVRADRPTAMFVSNGLMALGVLKAMSELGLECPREVALASFDDLALAEVLRPPLTTVMQPAYEIGRRGVELLMHRIAPRTTKTSRVTKVHLTTELKIRGSTATRGS